MNLLEVEKKLAARIENAGKVDKATLIYGMKQSLSELRMAIYSKDSPVSQSFLWGKCPKCDNYLDHSGHCHNCEPLVKKQ